METVTTRSAIRMNFYLDGKRVLTVSEKNGRVDAEPTEYGLALDPERAAEFRDEVVTRAQTITESRCTGPLARKADESAKCKLLGLGAGTLGAIAGGLLGGPPGATVGGLAAGSIGVLCGWLVDKVCEENSEGC